MLIIEIKVTDGDEETTFTHDIPDHCGFKEELSVLATSISGDEHRPSMARVLAFLILPGLNVAMKTYADKRYKMRIAELKDYLGR